jgi:hypothetical protein
MAFAKAVFVVLHHVVRVEALAAAHALVVLRNVVVEKSRNPE